MLTFAEYIFVDGTDPIQRLRSKAKVINITNVKPQEEGGGSSCFLGTGVSEDFTAWNFDGSSTNQAEGSDSERVLQPACVVPDPLREDCYLVLCEVMNPDGTPHKSNKRAILRETEHTGSLSDSWWGFEQEYCLMDEKTDNILGWPDLGRHYPKPQGLFYCGVGSDEIKGREVVHEHAKACLDAGLLIYGHNAEVMIGQWEFQVGYRGIDGDPEADPLTVSDHLWLARYLLYRIGEKHGVYATLDPKPKKGDWNGSGMHTNFSDRAMRTKGKGLGMDRIENYRVALESKHLEHQKVYGEGNEARLTGQHETAHYNDFSMGTADRGASIRIPNQTKERGCGYIEDRRPAANADPYVVTNRILKTLSEVK